MLAHVVEHVARRVEDTAYIPGEMHRTCKMYAAISAVHGRLRAAADLQDETRKTVRARIDLKVRERLQSSPEAGRITEKRIEMEVDADPEYAGFLIFAGKCRTISEMAFGLRETVRMRFTMLEHRSHDQRAELKVGGV